MLKKKIMFSIIISIVTIQTVFCVKIFVADFNFYRDDLSVVQTEEDEKATDIIFDTILKEDFQGLLNINKVSNSFSFKDRQIKSTIDASELCNLLNIDYLLYGFIEKTNKYYNVEIRLFENATKTDKKTFFVKVELVDFTEVAEEISYKFIRYMYEILGLTDVFKENKKGFGGIGIYTGVGYWFPINDWWDVMTGLVCFEFGIIVTPINHIIRKRNFGFYIQLGNIVNYSLSISKPGYLKSYLNSLFFRISTDLYFEIFNHSCFSIGVGPQLQLDINYQEKLYDDPVYNTTAVFSLYWNYGYEYWFGKKKKFCIGIRNEFDLSLYDPIFICTKIQFYTIAKIHIKNKNK